MGLDCQQTRFQEKPAGGILTCFSEGKVPGQAPSEGLGQEGELE